MGFFLGYGTHTDVPRPRNPRGHVAEPGEPTVGTSATGLVLGTKLAGPWGGRPHDGTEWTSFHQLGLRGFH